MAFDLKQAITANWPIKATALALATVLWAAVAGEEPTTQLVPVSLIVDSPTGRVLAHRLPPVQALFSGSTREILKLYASPPVVHKVIPATYQGATYLVELSPSDLTLATDAAATPQDVSPRRIQVTLDSAVRRLIPVEPQITVRPDSGFTQLGPVAVVPESVMVFGPAAEVQALRFVPTVAVEFQRVRTAVRRGVALDTSVLGVSRLSRQEVEVTATITALSQRQVAGVPVTVLPRRGGIWTSDTPVVVVTLQGPAGRVEQLSRDSVSVTATPRGAGDVETVVLTVRGPEGVSVSAIPDSVTVRRRDRA